MPLLQVIVLALVQGITEFLPISSTAHLAMAPWLLVPIVTVWGYLTGLAICLGQRASVAVLQWSVALLIAAGLPFGPSDAALRAALVLAGGGLQAVLDHHDDSGADRPVDVEDPMRRR